METRCPHCSAINPSDARFCESCGKALPDVEPAGPRVVSGSDVATTETGRSLQVAQLKKHTARAAGALLAVAILQVIAGTWVYYTARKQVEQDPDLVIDPVVVGTIYGVGVVFFALYLWARRSPLPAAVVGFVVFISLHLVEAVVDPTSIGRGFIVKIIIVVVLAKAIQAGVQHRRISRGTQEHES